MSQTNRAEVVKEVGIFGLKTLLTLNSGAALVLLTFVGNVYGKTETSIVINLFWLKSAMGMFLAGIFFVMLSVMSTYLLAQLSPAGHSRGFLSWMVAPAVLSFVSFALGFLCAIFSLGV